MLATKKEGAAGLEEMAWSWSGWPPPSPPGEEELEGICQDMPPWRRWPVRNYTPTLEELELEGGWPLSSGASPSSPPWICLERLEMAWS